MKNQVFKKKEFKWQFILNKLNYIFISLFEHILKLLKDNTTMWSILGYFQVKD